MSPLKEKSLSIPRLELQAAVLGARIKSTIIEQVDFQIDNITLYSDSKVTLNCISNSSRKFLPFVMNRLNEIRTNTEIKQWKYIPGDLNPADMCTRYHSFQCLNSDSIWIRGINFLYRNKNENAFEYVIENNEIENFNVNLATNLTTKSSNSPKFISSIKWNHYSSYYKLLKHIAWILKLKRNYISCKRNKEHKSLPVTNLNIQDIECAENEILKHCQLECFENEFVDLVKGLPLKSGKLIPLPPLFKDGLIRIGGRIGSAYIPYSSKHQIIISNNHPIASLLVFYIHVTNFHSGLDLPLNLLRESYWIINAKYVIRKILKSCLYCKRLRNQPKPPIMSDLPPERFSSLLPPFYFTGVDYFGPSTIKLNKGTRRTSGTAKRYGALFTCLATRAVHLELAGDMLTDSFVLALRRFKARRGHPIRSDNGSNVIGAERELKDALSKLDQKKIINELNESRIQRMFNPPKSPWMGGARKPS